jgi:arylsulfatase A-like enzyme
MNILNNKLSGLLIAGLLLFLNQGKASTTNYGKNDISGPNIIFILTDDQRWDALGYAGNKIIQTPEMDKLAKRGAYFKNAVVTTPICSASRASIFTGLYERTHRYTFQTGPLRNEYINESYPAILKKSGYHTGFFGKFGVNVSDPDRLFDIFENYDRNGRYPDRRGYYYKMLDGDTVHLTRYTGQKALEFIGNAPSGKPFCLSLSFSAPHAHDPAPLQYFWQEESDHLYQKTDMPGPSLADDKYFSGLPLPVREGFNRLRWTWRFDTPEKYQHSVKGYYRMIHGIDLEIAKIRRKLKERGIDKNTVIIVMGDNGYFLGERQLAGKWLMYDNSIRVPLIIYDPRIKKQRDIEDMALNIDIPATILDLAGIDKPPAWHGQSLVPMVTGERLSTGRDTILAEHLWEFENIPPSEGVRTAEWKYFRYVNDKSAEELYNLKKDPAEAVNLAKDASYADVLDKLRKSCDRLTERYADKYSGVPHGLMVEYIREPEKTRINDDRPGYSWIVPGEAVYQKAYQILVSSDRSKIDNNIGDIWDSKPVRSNMSVNIEHAGEKLKPDSTYFWKVRIFDKDNRLSDYSAVQQFHTGSFKGTVSSKNFFQVERISPVSFSKLTGNSYFIDFGKDAFGTIELDYKAKKPEVLTVRLGEKLSDGKIDRDPGGSIRYQEVSLDITPGKQHYTLKLPPDKRNTGGDAILLPDSFGVVLPFRYCEIENASENIEADDIRQKAFFHYFDYGQSSFSSSDDILNQVWDICKYSMKATSFAGLYIDGDRERIPYEADAYINQLGHYCTDREYAMARQTIEYFMYHPTWPTEWLLHTAMMIIQDYYYTGDAKLIEEYYEMLKNKTLKELAREDGLISTETGKVTGEFMGKIGFADTTKRLRDIVDWPQAQKGSGWKLADPKGESDGHQMLPVNTVVNCFFYENMKIMAEVARLLNKPADEDEFQYMASKVKKTINEKLFDFRRGIYIDGEGADHSSLHSNMLPLAFDIVPEKYKSSVVDFVKSRGMACSVYGAQFLMEGLYKAGEGQYALDLMRSEDERSWWNMIRSGSTITMEAWDMKYKPNSDWNHAWGAVPANIVPRWLWGIRPQTPGFGIVTIDPLMGDLKHSSIVMPTIRGKIEGRYEFVNSRYQKYSVILPANMAGEFNIDVSSQTIVTLNGEQINPHFGSVRLKPGTNNIEVRINSF